MEENKRKFDKFVIAFNILVLLVLGTFFIGEFVLPKEDDTLNAQIYEYSGSWMRVYDDGKTEKITVPGKYDVAPGEHFVYETILPDIDHLLCYAIRSSQQTVRVYIEGDLRAVYDTEDSRPFGKNPVSAYVFWNVDEKDSGKVMRIEQSSYNYFNGTVNNIFYGSDKDILVHVIKKDGMGMVLAYILLILGIVTILVCVVISACFKRKFALQYLGWCITWAAIWVLSESNIRQFIVPNSSVLANTSFYAIILIPYAAALYIDTLQENRYHKVYVFFELGFIIDMFICTVLQVAGILDLIKTMYLTHVLIIGLSLYVFYSIYKDIKQDYLKLYKQVAIGLAGFGVSGIIEIIVIYTKEYQSIGLFLTAGLIFLLIFSAIKTGKDIINIESDRKKAVILSESKGKFLANMSHEIRTPINSIIGMNEMVLRECSDPKILEYSKQIEDSSRLLLGLVNDVLDYSKIESGKLSIIPREYETGALIRDVLDMFRERAHEKGLVLKFDVDSTLPVKLLGDDIRIRQILVNLLSNAIKYTEKGFIVLVVRVDKTAEDKVILQLAVEDSGQGIREENISRLFDSFTRMEESKNRSIEGTGLGLSITNNLVTLMDGQIHVSSKFGKGSTFTVFVPQDVVDGTAIGEFTIERKEKAVSKKGQEKFIAPKAKILVVDDNSMNRVVMRELLKRIKVQLSLAESGEECLRLCRYTKYDLIFMDHLMPEMDGIETLEQLKIQKDGKNTSTKVVALTANVIEGAKDLYLNSGFVAYLSKPIEVDKLESLIAEFLPQNMIDPVAE